MPKINPRIKSIDDLLGLDAAEESPIEPTPSVSLPTKNTIITLPPQAIRAFRGHPFRLYEGDRLNDLVESISEHGVLNPAIIRKIERDEDGFEYEMLAGHNRQNAAAIANRELPCIVKENLSDEDFFQAEDGIRDAQESRGLGPADGQQQRPAVFPDPLPH